MGLLMDNDFSITESWMNSSVPVLGVVCLFILCIHLSFYFFFFFPWGEGWEGRLSIRFSCNRFWFKSCVSFNNTYFLTSPATSMIFRIKLFVLCYLVCPMIKNVSLQRCQHDSPAHDAYDGVFAVVDMSM